MRINPILIPSDWFHFIGILWTSNQSNKNFASRGIRFNPTPFDCVLKNLKRRGSFSTVCWTINLSVTVTPGIPRHDCTTLQLQGGLEGISLKDGIKMYRILRLHTGFWMRTDTLADGTDSTSLALNSPAKFGDSPGSRAIGKGTPNPAALQVGYEIRDIDDFILLFTLLVWKHLQILVWKSMWHLKTNHKTLRACDLTLLNFWMPIEFHQNSMNSLRLFPQEVFIQSPSPQRQDDTWPHLR